ncbi:MAG: hypothetical protein ABEJ99_06130 [Candidatus Nanohaloarchaea archaeon]
MAEEILRFDEDIIGNLEFDQQIELEGRDEEGESETSHIYMARPYDSLYDFEKGVVNLALCFHEDYELEELEPENPDYSRIYR